MSAIGSAIKGRGLKTRLKRPIDEFWEQRLGINTLGFAPAVGDHAAPDVRMHYVPTPYRKLLRTLRHVDLGADDVFVDFGSGLGRAVFLASWLGARRSVGIEANPDLVAGAQANLARARHKQREIAFACMFAQDYDPDETTVLYMFHPFGPATMAEVIERLDDSLERKPRDLRIVYENPVNGAVLDRSSKLVRVDSWGPDRVWLGRHPTAFWRAR